MMTVAFTGGGTGGHIYPGLAVAYELKKRLPDIRLIWIGASSGIDRSILQEDKNFEFFGIPSGKLRRYFSFKNFADFFKVIVAFFAAKKILKKQKAVLIFSKGGFVSVPPCAAACALKIPVFTHESDFSPGLATKINVRYVFRTGGKIFTAYEDTVRFFKEKHRNCVIFSGQPVRASFYKADPAKGRAFLGVSDNARILLVLGGSQGAKEVNELVRAALPNLTAKYIIVHQVGPNNRWNLLPQEKYKPYSYINEEINDVMAAAEIVAGRSGAGIFEWAVCGKPMILIPLRGSGTRGDQAENAHYFEKAGAAVVLKENANSQEFIREVEALADNAPKRNAMAEASLKIGERNASELIARFLEEKINEL